MCMISSPFGNGVSNTLARSIALPLLRPISVLIWRRTELGFQDDRVTATSLDASADCELSRDAFEPPIADCAFVIFRSRQELAIPGVKYRVNRLNNTELDVSAADD